MLPCTSPPPTTTTNMVDENDIESMTSLYSASSMDNHDDSFHCQYTVSAILIEEVSTPSYCIRSNASPRSFLFPLSRSWTSSFASDTANVVPISHNDGTTRFDEASYSSNATFGTYNSLGTSNHATVGTTSVDNLSFIQVEESSVESSNVRVVAPSSIGDAHSSSHRLLDLSALSSIDSTSTNPALDMRGVCYDEEESMWSRGPFPFALRPFAQTYTSTTARDFFRHSYNRSASSCTSNGGSNTSAAPLFYYDDDQYEEHVNIWASRVWTSSSGKDEDIESFLQAMDTARGQLAQQLHHSQQHMHESQQPTTASSSSCMRRATLMHAISELPEVPHHLTYPTPSSSSSSVFGPMVKIESDESTSTILSPVIQSKLGRGSLPWFHRVFLLPHEPLRRALQTIRRLVHPTYLPFHSSHFKMPAFFAWFDQLALYIRTICHVKTHVVLSAILGVNPSLVKLLVATVKSYEAVLSLLDAVRFFRTFQPTTQAYSDLPNHGEMAWASYVLQLAEYVATLEHILCATLDRDEQDFGQALASTFNHESYVRQIQKRTETALPPHVKRVIVPWMLDGCDQFGGAPDDWQWGWWSKCMYETVWRRYYANNVVAHLHTLEFGTAAPTSPSSNDR
ncbi:hypothetical protein H257_08353 [Aphanomyces astaci]|uniref:Uncharacterized protein n=1 Tax=Aphanomyces astaci TaxID=112090 RepID=W4GGS6_APHAT|nr:hypothetical protein H257_08353 [Aphanomyces astaci]ETV78153.1 hypothetical protein H257_08353 [Aphanomyces astaci]RQM21596.1 hypothetical protein B5M09_009625 [Aphanomyces astaci]|eukprot:XP_009832490.1 hypothetical protein H257_08353 [Aphanomyces astaci]